MSSKAAPMTVTQVFRAGRAHVVKLAHKDHAHQWRVQTDDRGRFDEVAVRIGRAGTSPALVLHAEMLNDHTCFVEVCGLKMTVHVTGDNVPRITMSEDVRDVPEDRRCPDLRDPELDAPKKRSR